MHSNVKKKNISNLKALVIQKVGQRKSFFKNCFGSKKTQVSFFFFSMVPFSFSFYKRQTQSEQKKTKKKQLCWGVSLFLFFWGAKIGESLK